MTRQFSTLTFSSDSSMLAGGSENGTILVWDTGTSKQIHSFDRHTGLVSGLIFLDGDRILISSSLDGTIQLWDLVAPGANISPPQQHRVPVYAVAFAPQLSFTGYRCTHLREWKHRQINSDMAHGN